MSNKKHKMQPIYLILAGCVLYVFLFFESAFMLKGLTDYNMMYQYSARCVICHYDSSKEDCVCLRSHGLCEHHLYFDQSFVHGQMKRWYEDIHAMRVPHISFGFSEYLGARKPYMDMLEAYLISVDQSSRQRRVELRQPEAAGSDPSQRVYVDYWQRVADHFSGYHFFMPFF